MPPCTELHVPYKKWGFEAGVADPHRLEQNFLAIERWARQQTCGGSGPKSWCTSGTLALSAGETDSLSVSVSGNTDTLIVTASAVVTETGSGGTVDLVGYFTADGTTLNAASAIDDYGWTWPEGATRTMSSTCTFDATSTVGFTFTLGGGSTSVSARVTLTVLQATDHQTDVCCSTGG